MSRLSFVFNLPCASASLLKVCVRRRADLKFAFRAPPADVANVLPPSAFSLRLGGLALADTWLLCHASSFSCFS